ncbi:P-loop containing nucleoside triphosphate hydrolase protein, partial [Rozella allomycis CSF55]
MDNDFYDEFGNYIGPEEGSGSDNEKSSESEYGEAAVEEAEGEQAVVVGPIDSVVDGRVILHEDKKYYPSAEEVYGEEVEAMVQDEDTQALSVPIIAPLKTKRYVLEERDLPETTYSKQFLVELMGYPERIRNVSIVGHLHHGKTALMDVLVRETHEVRGGRKVAGRYTDANVIERERGCSIKASPMSLVMSTSKGTSYLMNVVDTPGKRDVMSDIGHVNFSDEVSVSMRVSDGVVLVVDAVEGVMMNTERVVRMALREGLPLVLMINKVDRLILELRLPPNDAYFKLKHTIEELNMMIKGMGYKNRLSPELGNVCFGSSLMGFCFSLKSFARMYSKEVDCEEFSKRLWGDLYFNEKSRRFTRESEGNERSFVHFVLKPIYKLTSIVIGEETKEIKKMMIEEVGVELTEKELNLDVEMLMRRVYEIFFGDFSSLIDMIVEKLPSPMEMKRLGRGNESDGEVCLNLIKNYSNEDGTEFYSFGRVFNGTLRVGMKVKVLENEDEEDLKIQKIEELYVYETRYKIKVDKIPAGNFVLIKGVEFCKSCTVYEERKEEIEMFKEIKFDTKSIVKLSIEPNNPSELPKMLDGLKKVLKTYPCLETKVEESGEHVIFGTGEFYLDCVLHDLRNYSEIEIKVSDPIVKFSETVIDTSCIKCYAETPNKKNKLTMIAEPLDKGLDIDISLGLLNNKPNQFNILKNKYNWDVLAANSIWAFGPSNLDSNILLDDSLLSNKSLLNSTKYFITQGFQWSVREGPLCDERNLSLYLIIAIRNVKYKILDAVLANESIYRGGGQIIPTARRVCYSSFLMASPRLMEPVYLVEIQTPADCVSAIYSVLANRRGHVTQDIPKAGSPLYTLKA